MRAIRPIARRALISGRRTSLISLTQCMSIISRYLAWRASTPKTLSAQSTARSPQLWWWLAAGKQRWPPTIGVPNAKHSGADSACNYGWGQEASTAIRAISANTLSLVLRSAALGYPGTLSGAKIHVAAWSYGGGSGRLGRDLNASVAITIP